MNHYLENAKVEKDEIVVQITGFGKVSYCFFWFRDNCRCSKCYSEDTFQRKNDILDIPEDAKPKKITFDERSLHVEWDDGHESAYSADFLFECWSPNWRGKKFDRHLWSGDEIKDKVVYAKKDEFLNSEDVFKKFLKSLVKYGVAFVDEVENNIKDTEKVIRRVGPVMSTLFGEMWSFTSDMARADTAYTTMPLGPHTDNTYFEEAAGLQILHCLEHTGTGGETLLLDGFYGAEILKNESLVDFKILTEALQPAQYLESGWNHSHTAPVIITNPINDQIQQIRFNTYDRSPHCVGKGKDATEYYAALKALARKYTSQENQWHFKLQPGRVLFFDNWRVLHGRTGFTGKRVLGGAYVSRRDWLSAARVRNLIP